MRYRFLFAFIAGFVFFMQLRAQPGANQYQFRRLDIGKGLSNNQVTCMLKDSKGYLWFGTLSGLNRYDGYRCKVFRHNPKDSSSINDDYISRITEMPDGKIIVETREWLNIYDPLTEKFSHDIPGYLSFVSLPSAALLKNVTNSKGDFFVLLYQQGIYKIAANAKRAVSITKERDNKFSYITSFSKDTADNIWLIRRNGIIEKIDGKQNRVVYSSNIMADYLNGELLGYNIFVDMQGELWIHAAGGKDEPHGIFKFNPLTGELLHISKESAKGRLNTDLVIDVLQDSQSRIWVCTDHGGINIIDKKDYSIQYYVNNPDNAGSLSQNSITSVLKDDAGIIWVGTFKKGVNYYHEDMIKFPLYRHQASHTASLPYDDVNRFTEDAQGNFWMGTNGGGLIYFDRHKNTYRQFRHDPANPASLCNDVIVSLCIDRQQRLWIGTYQGGMDMYDGRTFRHYPHNAADSGSIASNSIWEIYEDKQNNLWIGTLGAGMDLFDRQTNIFHHYNTKRSGTLHSDFISDIQEDQHNNLWIATAYGVDVLNTKTKTFTHYDMNAGLSSNNVIAIRVVASGEVWVGTREGLNYFNKAARSFQHFTVEDGLPSNTILNILEVKKGILWISTPNGISEVVISRGNTPSELKINCKNYDNSDGLQGTEFNENAALRTSSGELVFGGADGFNIFRPENIVPSKALMRLVFTDFQLFNNSVAINEKINGKVLLSQSINHTKIITLNYNQNVIAIGFTALDFSGTEKSRYAYMLEGFSKNWLYTDDKMRKAVFTNLDPGNYTFRVKSANDSGSWNMNEIALQIKILPPFWKSLWAYLLYGLVMITVLYVARRMIIQKTRMQSAIEREREEAQRMHDLDLMKIKFFTNVSHEFRTPLSLILSPVENMLKQNNESGMQKQLQMVNRNARRLLNLVNQLLDFRKMEEKELTPHPCKGDIIAFISDVSHFFSDVAERKNISFSFHTNTDRLYTEFDHDKIERILFNVLSNAFKFTPESGHVGVDIMVQENDVSRGLYQLNINVQDTGIGIDADKHEKIFERFFQNEVSETIVNQGSGIGLAISREFVRLHGGSIIVESEPGKGSCFTISLPVLAVPAPEANVAENLSYEENTAAGKNITDHTAEEFIEDGYENQAGTDEPARQNSKKQSLLLIEDNEDFRFYLKDKLQAYFKIIEASNGKQGWQKALAAHPDLIVSDISMPEMNGIDLCIKLKNDKRTSHIPVILLTALAGEDLQLKGLETGANDYMTKPFTFEILLSKIRNLLSQQQQSKKTYQKQVAVNPVEVVVESADEKFMQQVLLLVEKNMSESDFSVEDMSREMFMSRVALYKKLLALTGKTPLELIRQIRLKRAAQLLEKSNLTVAEVAYSVGFNNPKYFSKYFKAEFDKLPSAYAEAKRSSKI